MSRQAEINDALYAKWEEWIERIYDEIVTLFSYRSYYRGLAEMTQAHGAIPPSSFFDALGSWYGVTQAMGVRRQTDSSANAVSLAKLLDNMANNPQVMTRERYLRLWDDEGYWQRRGNEQYDTYAGAGAAEITSERYQADRDRFADTARPIKDYADRLVAHNDQRELDQVPTYVDLNAAIDLLEELLNKYMVLLKVTSVPNADPVHQADWRDAFRVPWLV